MAEAPFQVTAEEVDKISKALKNDEFRKLFFEYAQEISDPENKQRYENELIELEKMRGVDMKFIKPTPGFVLKTLILPEGKEKLFVNVCTSEELAPAEAKTAINSLGRVGTSWNIPYSLTPPREDRDKEKNKCTVVDAVFHPDTYERSQQTIRFKQLLIDTALDGIEQNFKIKSDRKKVKTLKLSCKGVPTATVIRTPKKEVEDRPETVDLGGLPLKVPYPPLNGSSFSKPEQPPKEKEVSEPRYCVLYSGEFTMQDFTNDRESSQIKRPKNLIVKIELPGVESASSVELDIYEKRLTLDCAKPLYKLDLALGYPIDSDKGNAKFDKLTKTLTVTLPVLPPPPAPSVQPKQLISEVKPESSEKSQNGKVELSCDSLPNQNQEPVFEPISQTEEKCSNGSANQNEDEESRDTSHPVTNDWSSIGEWCCPPFSFRQDDSSVTFLLYTPGVKEKSMVVNFDQDSAQLTYRTATGRSYSFFVCFSGGCTLEADDCVVDVSDENVVILLTKDNKGVWDRFQVGLNAQQTQEKLFLTESNAQSAIEEMESFPDPWVNKELSDTAQVKVVSESDSRLDIEIVDATKAEASNFTSAAEATTSKHDLDSSLTDEQPTSQEEPELSIATERKSSSSLSTESSNGSLEESHLHKEPECYDQESAIGRSSEERSNGSFVEVKSDGSMFVQADTDYVESGTRDLVSVNDESTKKGEIELSNKMMFTLD